MVVFSYEALNTSGNKQKQSKSFDDLLEMVRIFVSVWHMTNDFVALEICISFSFYSQEQQQQNGNNGSGSTTPSTPTQEALAMKKALEWELSLDKRDLRSHAWYHSIIPRQRAEELLAKDEDFLVRDCMSQPGNYVLSCRSKGIILHFVINKVSARLMLIFANRICLERELIHLSFCLGCDSTWHSLRTCAVSIRGRRLWHCSGFDNVLRWLGTSHICCIECSHSASMQSRESTDLLHGQIW